MSVTDGALSSKRVPNYGNIGRKLATLTDKFMKSFIPDKNGERKYLSELYRQANNLHIVFTGVSESQIDISQFLLGSNYTLDYLGSVESYVKQLNDNSAWKAQFFPSDEFKVLIDNPKLAAASLNDLGEPIVNSLGKGIWRYVKSKQSIPLLGEIKLKSRLSRDTLTQPVIAGDEHSLDTVLDTYKYIYLWTNNWRANIPVMYQPLDHLHLQLHKELRCLTLQYNLDIYNYFRFGSIHSTASSEIANYVQEHIKPLKYAFNMNVRTYSELHNLALQMNNKEFVDQLKLNEIPLDIFKTVIKRWPKGQYSLPLIQDLGCLDQNQVQEQHKLLELHSEDCIYAPNSIYPESKIKVSVLKSPIKSMIL